MDDTGINIRCPYCVGQKRRSWLMEVRGPLTGAVRVRCAGCRRQLVVVLANGLLLQITDCLAQVPGGTNEQ